MKKLLSLLLILTLLVPSLVVFAASGSYSDIENHWSKEFVLKLTEKGIFEGYADGTFKPNNNITVAEFIKIVTVAIELDMIPVDGPWYQMYVNAARNAGLVVTGEFSSTDFNRPITRGEMARIVVRAVELEEEIVNYEDFKTNMADFWKIPSELKNYVLKTYATGIITGYADGTFKHDQNATRAECSVMMLRMIEKEERVEAVVQPPKKPTNHSEYAYINPDFPIELYELPAWTNRLRKDRAYWSNKTFYNNDGEKAIEKYLDLAKAYVAAKYNFDYKHMDDEYLKGVLYYIEPAHWFTYFDVTEDDKITNYQSKYGDEIMNEFIAEMKKHKVTMESELLTDYSLVYGSPAAGHTVRGIMRVKFSGETSQEYLKQLGVEKDTWYQVFYEVGFGISATSLSREHLWESKKYDKLWGEQFILPYYKE